MIKRFGGNQAGFPSIHVSGRNPSSISFRHRSTGDPSLVKKMRVLFLPQNAKGGKSRLLLNRVWLSALVAAFRAAWVCASTRGRFGLLVGGFVFFSGQIAIDFITGRVVGDDIEAQKHCPVDQWS